MVASLKQELSLGSGILIIPRGFNCPEKKTRRLACKQPAPQHSFWWFSGTGFQGEGENSYV
jgi:hypothetical protein